MDESPRNIIRKATATNLPPGGWVGNRFNSKSEISISAGSPVGSLNTDRFNPESVHAGGPVVSGHTHAQNGFARHQGCIGAPASTTPTAILETNSDRISNQETTSAWKPVVGDVAMPFIFATQHASNRARERVKVVIGKQLYDDQVRRILVGICFRGARLPFKPNGQDRFLIGATEVTFGQDLIFVMGPGYGIHESVICTVLTPLLYWSQSRHEFGRQPQFPVEDSPLGFVSNIAAA